MGWTAKDIPNQSGRVAVVTGANVGLGFETANALAGAGAHVVMASRNLAKAEAARAEITTLDPQASVEVVQIDLASQATIKTAAATIRSAHPSIDMLINNAGVMATPEQKTDDGYEMQFGVNHLGHWTLTAELLPNMVHTEGSRVVTVTSVARHQGRRVDPDNPHLHATYTPWGAYAQAKLANYHFGLGLHDRFSAAGVATQSLLAHPGLSNTNLQAATVESGGGGWLAPASHEMAERFGMSPTEGSRPQLRAATDPTAKGGELYGPRFGFTGPAVRLPVLRPGSDAAINTLWAVSTRETDVPLNVATIAER